MLYFCVCALGRAWLSSGALWFPGLEGNPITLDFFFFFTFLDVVIIRKYSELKLTANFKPVITALERSKESFYCIT